MARRRCTVIICAILMNTLPLHAENLPEAEKRPGNAKETNILKDFIHTEIIIGQKTNISGLFNFVNLDSKGRRNQVPSHNAILSVRQYLQDRRRHNQVPSHNVILSVPKYPQDLPAAEPILPGHTLLRPSRGMLKSSVKYPLRDLGGAVYGNLDNVGITWGKTRDRIRYSNFRKANENNKANLLLAIQKAVQNRGKMNTRGRRPLIVIEIDPSKLGVRKQDISEHYFEKQRSEQENNAMEENEVYRNIDDWDEFFGEDNNERVNYRRKSQKSKFRQRKKYYKRDATDDESTSSSTEVEKNPGNPLTIYKNKYMQNWMWNHEMDGDHMNISPYAPDMNSLGPSGADVFFGRKWWYFNQDDFKPMRRRK